MLFYLTTFGHVDGDFDDQGGLRPRDDPPADRGPRARVPDAPASALADV